MKGVLVELYVIGRDLVELRRNRKHDPIHQNCMADG